MKFDGTDTYPVGVLSTLQIAIGAVRAGRRKYAAQKVRGEWRYIKRQARARNWRAVRNSFNGYLAEHQHGGHNAGKGWTKRAAQRRVERICKAAD